MGIIETIKMLEREEGFENGLKIGFDKGFNVGIEKGIELGVEKEALRKSHAFVMTLLQAYQFTYAEIANFANVTEAFVEKLKKDLNLENN